MIRENLLINGFPVEASYDEQTVREIFVPLLRHIADLYAQNGRRVIAFLAAPPATGKSTLAAYLVVRNLMNLEWTFLPGVAVGVALGAMALTLAFGLAGTLSALRQRPLALLRNE